MDPNIQSEEKLTKDDWYNVGTSQKRWYYEEKKENLIKSRNDKMRIQIVYLKNSWTQIKEIKKNYNLW